MTDSASDLGVWHSVVLINGGLGAQTGLVVIGLGWLCGRPLGPSTGLGEDASFGGPTGDDDGSALLDCDDHLGLVTPTLPALRSEGQSVFTGRQRLKKRATAIEPTSRDKGPRSEQPFRRLRNARDEFGRGGQQAIGDGPADINQKPALAIELPERCSYSSPTGHASKWCLIRPWTANTRRTRTDQNVRLARRRRRPRTAPMRAADRTEMCPVLLSDGAQSPGLSWPIRLERSALAAAS